MLRVEGLHRRVGKFHLAVDQWHVDAGQYLVMVGPSGAGKTMLLETVAGLHRLDQGRIWIGEREITNDPPERRGIGFVYQDCWLFPHLTVRSNIDFGRRYHRSSLSTSAPRTEILAEMLNISDLLDRKPRTLSGGERQRVALARALAVRPRLLILDEPLGNLDPSTREHVASQLKRCHGEFEMTTIHVTHDHTEARMMGDAVAVILSGHMQQTGPTEDVFGRPHTVKLARFLGCENVHPAVSELANGGRVVVRWADYTIEVESHVSGQVVLCVSPEHVLLFREGETDTRQGMTGTIKEIAPRGPLVRVVMDVSGENWVSLMSRSEQRQRCFEVDDPVVMQLPTEACHLIPMESA